MGSASVLQRLEDRTQAPQERSSWSERTDGSSGNLVGHRAQSNPYPVAARRLVIGAMYRSAEVGQNRRPDAQFVSCTCLG